MAKHFGGDVEIAGDIRLLNADCTKDFDICETEDVKAGTVMVLGEDGVLFPSCQTYDKHVAIAPHTELNLNTSAELNYASLGNSELAHDAKTQAFVVDNKGKLLKNKQINSIKIPLKSKLEVKIQDWNTLDVSVRALKTQ